MGIANRCKEVGTTLAKLSVMTGVGTSTLRNWYNFKPVLFEIVLHGAVFKQAIERVKDNG